VNLLELVRPMRRLPMRGRDMPYGIAEIRTAWQGGLPPAVRERGRPSARTRGIMNEMLSGVIGHGTAGVRTPRPGRQDRTTQDYRDACYRLYRRSLAGCGSANDDNSRPTR